MIYPSKIDLHMHSVVSDGTDTPEEIIDCVRDKGIELFSLTDHDASEGCRIIRDRLSDDQDLRFITGVEFSCKDKLGKYHILGYDYDPDSEYITGLTGKAHSFRMKKLSFRLDFLRDRFGFVFPEEEIEALKALDNPGKPHIGNLMVKYGYAASKEIAIDDYINQAKSADEYIRPEEAIEVILKSGGIPVLAHPVYGSGDQLILGEEMDERLKRLIGFGLQGVEAFYSGFTGKLIDQMIYFATKYDLYVTAGSDYHGRNKMIEIGDTNLEDISDAPEGLKRFLENVLLC